MITKTTNQREDEKMTNLMDSAKRIACKPCVALNRDYVTTGYAKSLNITVNGPVVIKNGLAIVPINVFSFLSFRDHSKRVVLNSSDLSVKAVLPV